MNRQLLVSVFVMMIAAFGFRDIEKENAELEGVSMLAKAPMTMDFVTVNGVTIQKLAGDGFFEKTFGKHIGYYAALPPIMDFAANVNILFENVRGSPSTKEFVASMKAQYCEMGATVDIIDRSCDSAILLVRNNVLWCYQKVLKDDYNQRFVIVTGVWKHTCDRQAIKTCVDSANLATHPIEGVGVADLREESEKKLQRDEVFQSLNAAYESERLGRDSTKRIGQKNAVLRDDDVGSKVSVQPKACVSEEIGFVGIWWYKKEIIEREL